MTEKLHRMLFDGMGKSELAAGDLRRLAGLTYGSAKVTLNRLKRESMAMPSGRGKYVLVSPENWVRLERLKVKSRKLYALAAEVYRLAPRLGMLVLYGSQVTGFADEHSDFDILLVAPGETDERKLRKELEKTSGLKVHLTVCSEKAFPVFVVCEPYLKFWLSEGIVFDEAGLLKEAMKPTAKIGLSEFVETAKNYAELAKGERSAARKAKYCFTALKMFLMAESALILNYDYSWVRARLSGLAGEKLVRKIRAEKAISKREGAALERACLVEEGKVDALMRSLGENESDVFWKSRLNGGAA